MKNKPEYDRKWYHANKARLKERKQLSGAKYRAKMRAWVDELKSHPCTDCGLLWPSFVMEFDHQEDKKFNIADKVYSYSRERLEAEIKKCELVCGNCHAIRTHS